jgi:Ca2+-binding RTX toxin-like protein
LLAEAREPVELGSIVAGEFIVDGSWLPQELTDTGSWDYTYVPLLDPTDYGVTKQRFIGSAADDDFYASESPDEFVSGNTGSKHDHLTYHAIAMRGIEVDFDSGIVIEDGNGNQDIFEPHKFGMDGSQFGDEFYGIDNERIDGNGGDDFYHSLIDGAGWFNLRVGLGADLIVPTTDLSDAQWKTGSVRLSPDAVWGHGYYAENVNTQGGGVGTGELIALNGMGRYTDIVICRSDGVAADDVTFYLGEYVDEPSDDAFFLDDAFSDRHAEADTFSNRIGQFERFTSMQTLYAGDGDDLIDLSSARYENQASAAVFGGTGNDILWGGDSSEMLDGGEGDDVIFGGMGDDILIGGPGADEFQFTATSSVGSWDFNPSEDSITVFRRPGVDDGLVVEINAGIISLGGHNFGATDGAPTIDPSLTIDDLNITYEVI